MHGGKLGRAAAAVPVENSRYQHLLTDKIDLTDLTDLAYHITDTGSGSDSDREDASAIFHGFAPPLPFRGGEVVAGPAHTVLI